MVGEKVPEKACRSRLSYFLDFNALKVMLVLYRNNPDVSFRTLVQTTKIKDVELADLLTELMSADLIGIKAPEEDEESLFTLSKEARMSLNRLKADELLAKVPEE
jgi:hypothetical protein